MKVGLGVSGDNNQRGIIAKAWSFTKGTALQWSIWYAPFLTCSSIRQGNRCLWFPYRDIIHHLKAFTLLQKGDWELQLPGLEMRYYIQGERAAMTGHFIRIDVSGTN